MSENDHTAKCGDPDCERCYSDEVPKKLSMSLLQRILNRGAALFRVPTNSMGPQGSSHETIFDSRHRIQLDTSEWKEELLANVKLYEQRLREGPWHVRLLRRLRKPFVGPPGPPGMNGPTGMTGTPGRDSGLEQMYDLVVISELPLNPTERAAVHRHALRFVLETGNWIEGVTVKKTPTNPDDTYWSDSHLEIRIVAKKAPSSVTTNVSYKDAYFGNVHNFN